MGAGETIFLTGFPGFIAGRLVARLATPATRFLLLVQPAFHARAQSDIARIPGQRTVISHEHDLAQCAGSSNNYEETKYLAELEVEKLKRDLPVTIYRPAVVCGDSRTGETAKYDGVYYLIHYLRKAPRLLALA